MILLDTDIVVDVVRQFPPAVEWLDAVSAEVVAVSGFSAIELFAGCRSAAEQQRLDCHLRRFEVVWLSQWQCDAALQNYRALHLSHGIGAFDVLIGRTAIEQGLPLHTF